MTDQITTQTNDDTVTEEGLALVRKWFSENVVRLADLRKTEATDADRLASLNAKLAELQPELFEQIRMVTKSLAETRKTIGIYERSIRESAGNIPTVADELDWMRRRNATVVEVGETFAIQLAMAFLPGAVKLDWKIFNQWAKANQGNKLLVGITVKEVPGFTIASDLKAYETAPKTEEETE